jgi:hypothetical protein
LERAGQQHVLMRARAMAARGAAMARWSLPSSSTQASHGAPGGPRSWAAEQKGTTPSRWLGAPRGVMWLGATQSIAEKLMEVKFF